MASLLAEAEQQGLIDVFLVMVTGQGTSALQRQKGQSKADQFCGEMESQTTYTDHWRRLDGSGLAWEQECLGLEKGDCILQVASGVFDFHVLLLQKTCAAQTAATLCMHGKLFSAVSQHTTRQELGRAWPLFCHIADKLPWKVLAACHTHQDAGPILLWVQRLPPPQIGRLARDSNHVSGFLQGSAKHESMCLC